MRSELKDKIRSCQVTLGSWITIPHPIVAEIMAKAGFDWLAVDLEHTMTDLGAAGHLLQVIDLCGVSPLVRLTNNDRNQIKRLLDAGPQKMRRQQLQQRVTCLKVIGVLACSGRRNTGRASENI